MKKPKLDPIFKGLPEALKDPKNYVKTERKLAKALKTDHKHKTPRAFQKCKECQAHLVAKRALMKEIGFKNLEQYYKWKNVMAHFLPMSKSIKYENS